MIGLHVIHARRVGSLLMRIEVARVIVVVEASETTTSHGVVVVVIVIIAKAATTHHHHVHVTHAGVPAQLLLHHHHLHLLLLHGCHVVAAVGTHHSHVIGAVHKAKATVVRRVGIAGVGRRGRRHHAPHGTDQIAALGRRGHDGFLCG